MQKEEETLDELTLNQLKSAKNDLDGRVNACYQGIIRSLMEFIQKENNKGDIPIKMKFLKEILDNLLKYVTLNSRMDELNRNIWLLEKEENKQNQTGNEEQKMEIIQEEHNNIKGDNDNNINSKFF
jgi:formylmethanofuran dehydrogenase subunit E-like metal-binding protein